MRHPITEEGGSPDLRRPVGSHVEYWQYDPDDSVFSASGAEARSGNRLEVFVPTDDPEAVQVEATGLGAIESVAWFGGTLFYARASGGP